MKTNTWFALVASLAVPLLSSSAQTPGASAPAAPEPPAAAIPATLSPGAAEVVRLATSGVGDEVVLAYIQNSQAAFNLSANDVLYLKDIGLSPEVTSAMLNHDTALRGQTQQYAPAATAPAPAAPPPATPAPAAAPAPTASATVAAAPAPVYVTSPPPDVGYFYNDLAPYGTWVQLDGYGWCWQPTAVVITRGWRPYCDGGYWVYSDLGWYWQSTYTWGWAPFHYGRWQMHSRCGWVWMPDRVWGPAWVTWRTTGDYCGWAPLPPHATFDVRLGWCYNNVAVGASFGFNLGSDAFLFVSFGDFCSRDIHRRCLPPARVATVYHQTTIVNNYVVDHDRVVHRGIPIDRVSHASRVPVPRANVRDWSDRPERMPTRAGSVVYRPRLETPARPVHMEAQKIDAQHPVIRHAPSGPPKVERAAAPGRGAPTGAAASRRQALEPPKVAPWSSSAQSRPAGSSGKAAPTSNWSRDARPASTPQAQPTSSAPQKRPAASSGKPAPTSDWSRGTRPAATPQAQPAPGAPRATPSVPASRAPQSSTVSRETKVASAPQVEPASTAPQSVTAVPPAAALPRAPDNWKQGTRASPSYRSDAGLPALHNTPPASRSAAADRGAGSHVYPPKSARQAAEVRPVPSPNSSAPASRPSPGQGPESRSRKEE